MVAPMAKHAIACVSADPPPGKPASRQAGRQAGSRRCGFYRARARPGIIIVIIIIIIIIIMASYQKHEGSTYMLATYTHSNNITNKYARVPSTQLVLLD